MLCQSCGSNIHIGMNQCPSCGEDVLTTYTAALPKRASNTGRLDIAAVLSEAAPEAAPASASSAASPVSSKSVSVESRTNGKPSEAVPSAVRPVMPPVPPPPPALPVVEPIREKNETSGREPLLLINPPVDAPRSTGLHCRSCSRELKIGAKFCSACGSSIEPSALSKAFALTKTYAVKIFASLRESIAQSSMPPAAILLIGFSTILLMAALIQYLIPIEVDSGSSTQLIYHLRSIEFLLAALIFMVAGLLFNKNR